MRYATMKVGFSVAFMTVKIPCVAGRNVPNIERMFPFCDDTSLMRRTENDSG